MKFRNKPVVIEAVQLTRNLFNVCFDFIGIKNIESYNCGEFSEDDCFINIKTLEGVMTASEHDWIIKGVKGEFYPIKNDIFLETYEKVVD